MEEKTFTIEEATEYTGIKRRTFERLSISYEMENRPAKDGKMRKVRVYRQTVLDDEMAKRNSKQHVPAVVTPTNDNPPAQVVTLSDLQAFAGMLVEGLKAETHKLLAPAPGEEKQKKTLDLASFKDKHILNFAQALALSGLPENDLRHALAENQIKAKRNGERGVWRIYRISLEEFCKNYFDGTKTNQNGKANSQKAGGNKTA